MDYANIPTSTLDSSVPTFNVSTSELHPDPGYSNTPAFNLQSAVPTFTVSASWALLNVDLLVGSYRANVTIQYALTDDDFIAAPGEDPIKVTRKRQADAFNQVQIECLDRANDYNICVVEAKDQWNIDAYGLRPMPLISCHAICVPQTARDMAQRVLQRALYIRNTFEFTLSWKYSRLEPMDLVSLTDAGMGMSATPVRIIAVEEDESGNLKITAEDFLSGSLTAGTYTPPPSNGYVTNQALSGGNTSTPIIFQPSVDLAGASQAWIAACGGVNWGGAEIWVSSDGATYSKMGVVSAPARFGILSANLPAGADPDVTNTLSVDLTTSSAELTAASNLQADALATLSYCGGELLAYAGANLTAAYQYNLTYLRRGQYGTSIAAHSIGETFLRLDEAVAKIDLASSWAGYTLYLKLPSFNVTGGGLQSLADVAATPYYVESVPVILSGGAAPSNIPFGQYYYIQTGSQIVISGRLTISGRLKNNGRLTIN